MSIKLFEHNDHAYHAALSMLRQTGKAAVIHPTGTGKSFIGFKFCEDFPEKNICWLSPSEYIFKTQLENLAADSGTVPDNITFLTYARLMTLEEDKIAAINPGRVPPLRRGAVGAGYPDTPQCLSPCPHSGPFRDEHPVSGQSA